MISFRSELTILEIPAQYVCKHVINLRLLFALFPHRDPKNFMDIKYKTVMGESATQWLSDGILNDQENLDLPLNYNNLSNEMTFILVFSM